MTNPAAGSSELTAGVANTQANALATRLEAGAQALAALARSLSEVQWRTRLPGDGRTFGVIVHHVATVYALEIDLARKLAAGESISGVTMAEVHAMNATHAGENAGVTKEEAVALLEQNSAAAAAAIRQLTGSDLAQAGTVSLYGDAPLTCQFLLEDHAVRHSYHHRARIAERLKSIC